MQKGKLKFTREAIELQKKLNWIKADKLILNSSLVFNPQRNKLQERLGILRSCSNLKLKVVHYRRKEYIAVESSIWPPKVVYNRQK